MTAQNCRALNHFHQVRACHRLRLIEGESIFSEQANLINEAPAEQETCFQAVAFNLRLEKNERLACFHLLLNHGQYSRALEPTTGRIVIAKLNAAKTFS